MRVTGAVLKYVGPVHESPKADVRGDFTAFSVNLEKPDGKPFKVEFKKSKNYTAVVPCIITFRDLHKGVDVIFKDNFARELMISYGPKAEKEQNRVLQFVEDIKEEEVNVGAFDEFKEPEKPKDSKKKGIQNEAV